MNLDNSIVRIAPLLLLLIAITSTTHCHHYRNESHSPSPSEKCSSSRSSSSTSSKSSSAALMQFVRVQSKLHPSYERAFAPRRRKRFIVFPTYCAMKITMVLGKHVMVKYPRGLNLALQASLYYPVPTIWQEWFPKRLRPSVRPKPTYARVKFPQFFPRLKADNATDRLKYVDNASLSKWNSTHDPIHQADPMMVSHSNANNNDDVQHVATDDADQNVQHHLKLHNYDRFVLKDSNWVYHEPQQQHVNVYNWTHDRFSDKDRFYTEGSSKWMKANTDWNRNSSDRYKNYENRWQPNNNSINKQDWSSKYQKNYRHYYGNANRYNNRNNYIQYNSNSNNAITPNRRQNWSLYGKSFKNNENTMTSRFSPLTIPQYQFESSSKFRSAPSSPSISSLAAAVAAKSIKSSSSSQSKPLSKLTTKAASHRTSHSLAFNSYNNSTASAYGITNFVELLESKQNSTKQQKNQYNRKIHKNFNQNWWQWLPSIPQQNENKQQYHQQHGQRIIRKEATKCRRRRTKTKPPSVLWSKSENFNSSKTNNSSSTKQIDRSQTIMFPTTSIMESKETAETATTIKSNDSSSLLTLPSQNYIVDGDKIVAALHITDDSHNNGNSNNNIYIFKNQSAKHPYINNNAVPETGDSSFYSSSNPNSIAVDGKSIVASENEYENHPHQHIESNRFYDITNEYYNSNNNIVDVDKDFDDIFRPPPLSEHYYNDLERHTDWKHYRAHRDRRDLYAHLEGLSAMLSISMKSCILRSICEAKRYLLPPGYSLIQDIIRILFTLPTKDGLDDVYSQAMKADVHDCELQYIRSCPISFLDILMHPNL